jgi:glycosyltransferase involved in cell wall biosynthesis
MIDFVIVIPTYKRPHLLKLLIQDIASQSTRPLLVIVVDGDPQSGEVVQTIAESAPCCQCVLRYVPSNHANLAFQRYLGWRAASETNARVLIYLDDDLRIDQRDALHQLLKPFHDQNRSFVGATAKILYPENREKDAGGAVKDRASYCKSTAPLLVQWFGTSRRLPAGSLSPCGHRSLPSQSSSDFSQVEWLRGGVMACRMEALTEDCFSVDLFGLAERGFGHGEDTLLSRRLSSRGRLAFVSSAKFFHPCTDAPKAYSIQAHRMGFGTAYSRRLLNDNYRWPGNPTFADRAALLKTYCGVSLLNWVRALATPETHRFSYALGYTCGAWKGLIQPPRATRLTPIIDWATDAKAALQDAKTITTT